MILVLTNKSDLLPSFVLPALEKKGASYVRLNTDEFPQSVGLTLKYSRSRPMDAWLRTGVDVDLSSIRTVWYRRPGPPVPDPRLNEADQAFVRQEARHAMDGLFYALQDRFWVNPYRQSFVAEHKPYQLSVASDIGLEVPNTLLTNDPDAVKAFFSKCTSGMVYKTLGGCRRFESGTSKRVYTTRLTADDLDRYSNQVELAPCLFQEYVPKQSEFRITVIGDRLFATEIDSQADDLWKDDWRRDLINRPPPQRAASIPSALEQRIKALMSRMGLVFGCLDFVYTPDGRFVFLEINPNGQWLWNEPPTGLPLLENFSGMLAQGTPHYLSDSETA